MTRRTPLSVLRVAVAGIAVAGSAACVPPTPVVPPSPIAFVEHVVDNSLTKAAFVVSGQVVGDADPELVAVGFQTSSGGPGYVAVYERGADLDTWTRTNVATPADGIKYPGEPTIADLDADGDSDLIVPGGFFPCEFSFSPCGSLQWFEQTTGAWVRHNILPPGQARFYHRAVLEDVDHDGITDLVTVGETSSSATTVWFRGTADPARFAPSPLVIGAGGGSLPVVADVDADGDADVISPQYFQSGASFVWFERTGEPSLSTPAGAWARHVITGTVGGGFALESIPNLLGDGISRWVGTNHVNAVFNGGSPVSGVFQLDPTATISDPWTVSLLSAGIQGRPTNATLFAPGVLGHGDVDGDGDIDLAVSGDGDARVFWLRQEADHTFSTFVVDEAMGQAGGALVTDLDSDGSAELVFSSFEQSTLRVYSIP